VTFDIQKPSLRLLPFLFVYLLVVYWSHDEALKGDEGRYLWFAENLLQGYFSPKGDGYSLWNGPGYPIFLMPFVALGIPKVVIASFNAILMYFSLVICFLAFRKYVSEKAALLGVCALGFWFPGYNLLHMVMSEYLTLFLISLSLFLIVNIEKRLYTIYLGVTFSMIMLTKVLFAYVGVACFLLSVFSYVISQRQMAKRYIIAIALAFSICSPYLLYTHSLTGKWFYWSNAGGMSLYWMSTPHVNEYGDWNSHTLDTYCWEGTPICNTEYFASNHGPFMRRILELPPLERDDAFKREAVKNITSNPQKYVFNIAANVSRMFFNYPESYMFPRLSVLARIIPGSILLSTLLLTLLIGIRFLLKLPYEVAAILIYFLTYLAGSSLVSAYPRMLNVILPLVFFYITIILYRFFTFRNTPT
jgi:hypothetical protein